MKNVLFLMFFVSAFTFSVYANGEQESMTSDTWTNPNPSFEEWTNLVKDAYSGSTVNIVMAVHPAEAPVRALSDEFTALTGVNVVIDTIQELNLRDKVLMESVSRTGRYDLIMNETAWMGEFVGKGVLEKMDDRLSNDSITPDWFDYQDFIPIYRKLGEYEGSVYGVPLGGETTNMLVRTDLVKKYGIDLDVI